MTTIYLKRNGSAERILQQGTAMNKPLVLVVLVALTRPAQGTCVRASQVNPEGLRQVDTANIPPSETDCGTETTKAGVSFKTAKNLFTGSTRTIDPITTATDSPS